LRKSTVFFGIPPPLRGSPPFGKGNVQRVLINSRKYDKIKVRKAKGEKQNGM
jgi:hypothetical protein